MAKIDLEAAIQSDDVEQVLSFLEKDSDAVDAFVDVTRKFTPLYYAAGYGRCNVAKMLLDHGARWDIPCSGGGCPIHVAASCNHVEILEHLVDAGCPVDLPDTEGNTALVYANDAWDATCWLVEHRADVNASDGKPLATALHHFRHDIAAYLIEHGAQATIMQHIALGREREVGEFLSNEFDDSGINEMLEAAQKHRRVKVVELLRRASSAYDFYAAAAIGDIERIRAAIVDNPNIVHGKNPRNERPVLLHAAMAGQDEVVAWLLDHGADPSVTDNAGMNLLHAACQGSEGGHDSTSTVQLALDRGIDINSTFRRGMTALHCATWLRSAETVQLLLDRGCDPDKKDDRGNRAIDFCGTRHHEQVRRILQHATD